MSGTWHLKDNLFDVTSIAQSSGTYVQDYNGYVTNKTRLYPNGANDVILTNAPVYQTGRLGRYYYPANDGNLSRLVDVGSRTALVAELATYTTHTNESPDTSTVDIGFHYKVPPAVFISGNNASGAIATYDFATGELVNSFGPDGAAGGYFGRGIAIRGTDIFYTDLIRTLSGGFGPSDGIHIAPYGTHGSGGGDSPTTPLTNPESSAGIADLAFYSNALYVFAGYPYSDPKVFSLNPTSGAIIAGPIAIGSPASATSDGFTVLPNGHFFINQEDQSPIYNEYDSTTGTKVTGGLLVDLRVYGFFRGTGVATAPDGNSLYFITDIDSTQTLVQTDLAGQLMWFQAINSTVIEDIEVVAP
jgi:hypothetical protein